MHRSTAGLWAAFVVCCVSAAAQAQPSVALTMDVRHTATETWRVDYRFAQPVTAIQLDAVGDYRQQSWKILTPGAQLIAGPDGDRIAAGGKPFTALSVEIATFHGTTPKTYAPFNRFSDGGTAVFLGHFQGDAERGKQTVSMHSRIRLKGLGHENVIAPPGNRLEPGGTRGYAYFGPAQAVQSGSTRLLLDPTTPDWVRDTLHDASGRLAQYYAKAYQRPLKGQLDILLSISGLEKPGLSMNGGAVLGQLAYRFEGKQLIGDHPKKRELLSRIVAHEMAHLWQLNVDRGGIGENDPWIHEGGAEAMALDALLQTGLSSAEQIAAYRAAQTATCDKLDHAVTSYDGIYACGLVRFDQAGVAVVPLWLAMMRASESSGAVYSEKMIAEITGGKGAQPGAPAPGTD